MQIAKLLRWCWEQRYIHVAVNHGWMHLYVRMDGYTWVCVYFRNNNNTNNQETSSYWCKPRNCGVDVRNRGRKCRTYISFSSGWMYTIIYIRMHVCMCVRVDVCVYVLIAFHPVFCVVVQRFVITFIVVLCFLLFMSFHILITLVTVNHHHHYCHHASYP